MPTVSPEAPDMTVVSYYTPESLLKIGVLTEISTRIEGSRETRDIVQQNPINRYYFLEALHTNIVCLSLNGSIVGVSPLAPHVDPIFLDCSFRISPQENWNLWKPSVQSGKEIY